MLKARQKLGKYRILKRLAEGGFAEVYKALDTVEGIPVALKVPYHVPDRGSLDLFRKEARLAARLDYHPNILPIKNAQFIDDLFVIDLALESGSRRR